MAQGLLITGPERRRSWRLEEREQILSEAFAPGAVASLVTRRHDVSTGLLYSWCKKALAQIDRTEFAQAAFLPAIGKEDRAASSAPCATARSAAVIEVVLDRGVRVRIEAGMPVAQVSATLKALR